MKIGEAIEVWRREFQQEFIGERMVDSVASGIARFDRSWGGLRHGALTVFAGPSGVGKTALLTRFALTCGRSTPVLWLCPRATSTDVAMRLLAAISPIDIAKVRCAVVSTSDLEALERAATSLESASLAIGGAPWHDATIGSLVARVGESLGRAPELILVDDVDGWPRDWSDPAGSLRQLALESKASVIATTRRRRGEVAARADALFELHRPAGERLRIVSQWPHGGRRIEARLNRFAAIVEDAPQDLERPPT